MPTIKKRINITADSSVESAISRLAKRDGVPIAAKAADLLSRALEIEEDRYFSEIASSRLNMKGKYVSHDKAWK